MGLPLAFWCRNMALIHYRPVAAVAIMIDKSATIVLAGDCVSHVPHSVLHILNTSTTQHSILQLQVIQVMKPSVCQAYTSL